MSLQFRVSPQRCYRMDYELAIRSACQPRRQNFLLSLIYQTNTKSNFLGRRHSNPYSNTSRIMLSYLNHRSLKSEYAITHIVSVLLVLCMGRILSLVLRNPRWSSSRTYSHWPRLFLCSTTHTRFSPVRHSFSYPLLCSYIQLDSVTNTLFFAVDKWAIFHIRSKDYLGSPPGAQSLREKLRWHLNQHVKSSVVVADSGHLNVGPYDRIHVNNAPLPWVLF